MLFDREIKGCDLCCGECIKNIVTESVTVVNNVCWQTCSLDFVRSLNFIIRLGVTTYICHFCVHTLLLLLLLLP